MEKRTPHDPKGLVFEAYRMPDLSAAECRTIFLDWALSLPQDTAPQTALAALLAVYRDAHPDHPMTQVLQEGRQTPTAPRRRGGWRSRPRPS